MGTSASGSGPKGKSPLLPSWATGGDSSGGNEDNNDQNQNPDTEKKQQQQNNPVSDGEVITDSTSTNQNSSNNSTSDLRGAKSSLSRVTSRSKGSTFKKAAKSYVRSTGGASNGTKSSYTGIVTGGGYTDFWSGVSREGLKATLIKYDLTDCIGKSTEEVFAKIADKIAPIGSTNDEAIARSAVMMAFDKLCERMIANEQDLTTLDKLDKAILEETVVEFVSAYIFKKWVYEAGLALEKNELSEKDAIDLESAMRVFVRDEVKSSLRKTDILKLDLSEGEGKKIVKEIFDLAYSTLGK